MLTVVVINFNRSFGAIFVGYPHHAPESVAFPHSKPTQPTKTRRGEKLSSETFHVKANHKASRAVRILSISHVWGPEN